MRRRRRQAETSEVALMAVMTKAMGAFLILMVFGMKYYIPDFTSEQIAAIVRSSLGGVRTQLEASGRKLKSGDYTREDLDRLQEQIDAAVAKLAQAERDVSRLQTRLDQAASQLRRVEEERGRLRTEAEAARTEIARLKAALAEAEARARRFETEAETLRAEVARMKAEDTAALKSRIEALARENADLAARRTAVVQLRYTCADAVIVVGVSHQETREPGKAEPVIPGDGSPGYGPIVRGPDTMRPQESLDFSPLRGSREVASTWMGRALHAGDALAVYAKYLNAVPMDGSQGPSGASISCEVTSFLSSGGIAVGAPPIRVGPQRPFAFIGLVRLVGERLQAVRLDEAQTRWFAERLSAAPCKAPVCDPSSAAARGALRGYLADLYGSRLAETPIGSPGDGAGPVVDELLDRYVAGSLDQPTVTRWIDLVAADPKQAAGAPSGPSDALAGEMRPRLSAAGVPQAVADAFLRRASFGWWSPAEREARLRRAGIAPLPGELEAQAAATRALPGHVALIKPMVEEGAMTAAQGLEWLALVTRAREAGRPREGAAGPPVPNPPPQVQRLAEGLGAKGFPEPFILIVHGLADAGSLKAADALDLLARTKGRERR
ncbi:MULTISPECIES: hypothetical protein [Methylobacteriaceae]|jgi:hypothetical protein|uniref:M-like protein n=2 Tax=Methylobacteriaceae TaxID=119045 RepID=A0A160PCY7_9HYPH|nr:MULTISPECIES: hypothetical protein [Methylobacteriaceae]MBY0252595.1 hypothetical protein [Methylobacterium organophilum]MDV2984032.1 hypothetical protein [Methylobacteriaceae bacterium AG10]BAU89050.1 M-like protein [Methylorubrum populi]GJE28756.1 Chromosome partition protein Smc [Methylobacterium organophilum]